MPNAHALIHTGFIVLPVAVAVLVARAARSWRLALAILAWMLISAGFARSGTLHRFNSLPPPIGLLLFGGLIATVVVGLSRWVRHLLDLPLATLIAAQAFRILVEILIHQSSTIGLAPRQMTWDGDNFDILTGLTALALAPFAGSAPTRLIVIWNCLGLALLLWVTGIAVVSFPSPLQRLWPSNTWVADFPYVWLPTILIPAGLLGHLIVFRKLATRYSSGRTIA